MLLPSMAIVRQKFPGKRLTNIKKEVLSQMENAGLHSRIKAGQTIGITVGSRGITNIVKILRAAVAAVKERGAQPVLLSAMGSHGGGTTQGQLAILHKLGINADSVGAAILAETESTLTGYTENNIPVYVKQAALDCDGIIVINRIKPHTSFHGPLESGIHKMIAVGLGGPAGAEAIHKSGAHELPITIPNVAREAMRHINLIMGLGIIENAYDDTKMITSVLPEEMNKKESLLLEEARNLMPSLPLEEIDLLIIHEMGKNFCGTGIDTNIIGRLRIHGLPEPQSPSIKRIAVLDLSDETNGNANGIGLADFTTRKLLSKIDFSTTYKNNLTSTFTQRAMLPITMENDKEAIYAALQCLGLSRPGEARVVRIRNTLQLADIQVSHSILDEVLTTPNVQLIKENLSMRFDTLGNLIPY